ncbi:MAG: hypothetical protein GF350_13350 [Chitinivibrionales bacterium]|nr:hypothetical protein [Chitinivibrionales bacterium]
MTKSKIMHFHGFICILVFLCIRAGADTHSVETRGDTAFFRNGWLEYQENVPVLHVKGTHYEAGLQYGVLLKKEIAVSHSEIEIFRQKLEKETAANLPWFKRLLFFLFAERYIKKEIESYTKKMPAECLEYAKGLSDGSGIDLEQWLLYTFWSDIFWNCFAFILKDGDRVIHGRNYDFYTNFLSKYPLLVDYDITGKYRFTSITFIGMPVLTTTLNESGLSHSVNMSISANMYRGKDAKPFCALRAVVENCENLAQADSVLRSIKLKNSYCITVGSGNERSGAIFDITGPAVYRNSALDNPIFVSNHFVSDSMTKQYHTIDSDFYYNSYRDATFKRLIEQSGESNIIDKAISILSNTDCYSYKASPLPQVDATINNVLSMNANVIDNTNKKIYFAIYPYYAAWSRWYVYDMQNNLLEIYKEADSRLLHPRLKSYSEFYWKDMFLVHKSRENVKRYKKELENLQVMNLWSMKTLFAYSRILGNNDQAKMYADKIIEQYPDIATGYRLKGDIFAEEKRLSKAAEAYEQGLKKEIITLPEKARIWYALAHIFHSREKESEARKYATKAIAIYDRYHISDDSKREIRKLRDISGE